MLNRRRFLRNSAAAVALASPAGLRAQSLAGQPQKYFVPWSEGQLDIHHISTGRGNSVLMICPDGTAIMVDAGAVREDSNGLGPARPNTNRRPGEWIARYARQHLRTAPRQELDYFVLTHFHVDHMGDLNAASPPASSGAYRLTGVTDVAELVPIRHLIDRGYPTYNYPAPITDDAALNYIRFAKYAAQHGTAVQQLRAGVSTQIAPQNTASKYASWTMQNLAANGVVWTGKGEATHALFPAISTLQRDELPTENACSIALRLSYGAFRYYIGGDLTCDTNFGAQPWMDVESAVAGAAGPVSVSALDHHGYYDATCPAFVRAMRSRVYVLQSWHASHPALSVLNELYSPVLDRGAHDVFATSMVPAAQVVNSRLSDRMLSQHGHIVVRVSPGGSSYEVFVLDDTTEQANVVLTRNGPYVS